ncbi:MAG: hypothetical protein IKX35_08135 [Bacteroidales bacterium]|nr:hypothetical protein [Bacteroidales bacterium]
MEDRQDLMLYGSENTTFGDKVCALVLALAPLLQHYKGIVQNAGFTVLLLITPMLFLRTYYKLKMGLVNKKCFYAIIPLIIFYFYTILIRDFNVMRLGYVLLLSWIFFCVSNGSINISYFFKYAKRIAVLATIAIIIQFIAHNFLGRTFDFRPLSLLVTQENIWVRTSVNYGAAGFMYRPSGFFLEPSHFFLYSFPIITVLLLSINRDKRNFQTALFLSLGLLLSTSGMGIAVVFGLWTLYFLIYKKVKDYTLSSIISQVSVRSVVIVILLGIVFYLAYRFVPFIQNAIDRVFVEDETSNAIEGRTRLVKDFVSGITGRAMWFGSPNVIQDLDFNIPGFFATYIKWGIVGMFFSYWFYGQGLFKLKGPYFWLTLIIVVISYFTAHTHGTFYMLYFVVFLMNGYYDSCFVESSIEESSIDESNIDESSIEESSIVES